jgi:hypothetical protein
MDKLIAVDPGLDTGIAVFEGSVLVLTSTVREGKDLIDLLAHHHGARVVGEKPPQQNAHQPEVTAAVVEIVNLECQMREMPVSWILPAQWKGTPQARLQEGEAEKCATQHELDAVGMGRFKLAMDARMEHSS